MGMRDIMVLVLGYSCCESPEWRAHAIRSVAAISRIAFGTPIDVAARCRWHSSSAAWRGGTRVWAAIRRNLAVRHPHLENDMHTILNGLGPVKTTARPLGDWCRQDCSWLAPRLGGSD